MLQNASSRGFLIATLYSWQTLYAGTIRFNVLLGAVKPVEEVSQEEIDRACKDGIIAAIVSITAESQN
jgi:ATP-binding cassette, subfamily B (MDR/TAP), member 1